MNFEIGKKIRLLRLSKGLTQEQLAEKLSVTSQSVSKWENCVTAPDIGLLPQISVELGVTIDELFSMTDESRLARIENLIGSSSDNTVIPERDFESYCTFLCEHKEDPVLKGRILTALAGLYNQQAISYRMTAARYAQEGIKYDPDEKMNHRALLTAWNGADRDWYAANHAELIAFYMDFVEEHPDNLPALQLLLDNLISDHRCDEAEYILAKLKSADSTSCRPLMYEARLHILRGDKALAEQTLDRMTAQFADDWLAWAYKGDVYACMAEYDKASECWGNSFEKQSSPRLIDDLLCLAQVAVIQKRFAKAAEYYLSTIAVLREDYSVTEGDMIKQFSALAERYTDMSRTIS